MRQKVAAPKNKESQPKQTLIGCGWCTSMAMSPIRLHLQLQQVFQEPLHLHQSSTVGTTVSKVNRLMVGLAIRHLDAPSVFQVGRRAKQVRDHCEDDRRVNTRISEWQWCHCKIKTFRCNGAQRVIMRKRALPPCDKISQEKRDKRVRSWPGRGPQGKSRQ